MFRARAANTFPDPRLSSSFRIFGGLGVGDRSASPHRWRWRRWLRGIRQSGAAGRAAACACNRCGLAGVDVQLAASGTPAPFNDLDHLKVVLIVGPDCGICHRTPQPVSFTPSVSDFAHITSAPFPSLYSWMYSFSGWNAATYIIGEMRTPQQNLPRALLAGTLMSSCSLLR